MGSDAAPQGTWLVLGGDIGGTHTRIVVAGHDGTVLGRGVAGGGNPMSHPDTATTAFGQALGRALEGLGAGRVRTAVVGMAGGTALHDPGVRREFDRVWSSVGLTCPPTYASDLEVAFASGTADAEGSVLIAGTGAVAGEISGHRLVRTVDGHGWLLGDDGSGFWVGREAARAALRALDTVDEAPGPLAQSVLRQVGVPVERGDAETARSGLIRTLNSRPPVRLAELAPLVSAAHAAGDPVAAAIVDEAARLLAQTLGRLRRDDESTPVVLAGSMAGEGSPVGARFWELVAGRFSGPMLAARDGASGAAWLALVAADTRAATDDARSRLIGPDPGTPAPGDARGVGP